ncbi:hypothetical protein, partial [Streptomyces hydrogenans]
MVPLRTGDPPSPGYGSVAAMNVRRTALPFLTVLLVGGCVALPTPHPAPAPRTPSAAPPALAPAA